jgi:hypothetical protein
MLFNYRYVNHSIESFQEYLDHLVKEVWCKATHDFSLDLLHPELREIVEEIYNTEDDATRGNTGDLLYGPITKIYEIFKTHLTVVQRRQVSTWYDCNNDIEALCACDPHKLPATYADIDAINPKLAVQLKDFCESLFTKVIHLKAVISRIGEIDDHYDAFVTENKEGKCPYCGFGDIKGVHHSKREAYDHFLPKGTYPFNSVNFHNLAPMCHDCNSSYKLKLDPIKHIDPVTRKNNGGRRRAFYSYGNVNPCINISVAIKTKDVTNLAPDQIDLQLTAQGRAEEVEAWKDVFGIEERYRAKCCGENDGKGWLSRVRDECQNYNLTPQQMLIAEIRSAENRPWADSNFLKKPFLEACNKIGII